MQEKITLFDPQVFSDQQSQASLRDSVRVVKSQRDLARETMLKLWPMHDSKLSSFAKDFSTLLPPDDTGEDVVVRFIDYIGRVLNPEESRQMVAIEFGGPGSRLFGGFPEGFWSKTFGVCLLDHRSIERKIADKRACHTVVIGDMFEKSTYRKIDDMLGGQNVDCIISRMVGALDSMTDDTLVRAQLMRRWYHLLGEPGLMFVEYRNASRDKFISKNIIQKDVREQVMTEWVDFIQKNYADSLEVRLSSNSFSLIKKSGAPEALPLLPSFDPKLGVVDIQ